MWYHIGKDASTPSVTFQMGSSTILGAMLTRAVEYSFVTFQLPASSTAEKWKKRSPSGSLGMSQMT
jgi:hypothetical protein